MVFEELWVPQGGSSERNAVELLCNRASSIFAFSLSRTDPPWAALGVFLDAAVPKPCAAGGALSTVSMFEASGP